METKEKIKYPLDDAKLYFPYLKPEIHNLTEFERTNDCKIVKSKSIQINDCKR